MKSSVGVRWIIFQPEKRFGFVVRVVNGTIENWTSESALELGSAKSSPEGAT